MQLHWPPRNRSIGIIDALALTGLIGLLVARFIPIARLPFWGCTLREATGWPCLGCGLTRAADRMSHFNVAGAWDANPLGTIAAGLFMVCIVASFVHLAFRVPLPQIVLREREKTWARASVVALVVVNWAWIAARAKLPELVGG